MIFEQLLLPEELLFFSESARGSVHNLSLTLSLFFFLQQLLLASRAAGYSYLCQPVTYSKDVNEVRVKILPAHTHTNATLNSHIRSGPGHASVIWLDLKEKPNREEMKLRLQLQLCVVISGQLGRDLQSSGRGCRISPLSDPALVTALCPCSLMMAVCHAAVA